MAQNAPPSHDSTLELKEEVFKQSYQEALLFLKHQDDKINRVLTALAFLTAAGVSLYIFSRPESNLAAMAFANANLGADEFFFAAFLVGVFASVSFALVALDPTSFAPRWFRIYGSSPESLLFYQSIADHSKEEWRAVYDQADLRERLALAYHGDARRLSNRAVHKVRRFSSANIAVQFTVVALTLLGITRLETVSTDGRWRLVMAVLLVYSALPAVDFLYFQLLDFPEVGPDYMNYKKAYLLWLAFWAPFYAVVVAGLVLGRRDWAAVSVALFGTPALRWIGSLEWARLGRRLVILTLSLSSAVAIAGLGFILCSR